MKIPAFALFERSLRLETRSLLMCWVRAGVLVLILFVLVPVQSMARTGFFGAPGLHFLQQMVWVNLVLITLAGVSYFASAITEEKEEMMLGLLRMTDLNPVAILLGKSTSRFIGALLLLLAQVPFILLAVTLGGVGLLQIAASCGTLLAYLFLVCNLALLFSVVCRTTQIAAAVTLALLMLFLFGPFWAAGLVNETARALGALPLSGNWTLLNTAIDFWRQATPSERLSEIFQTGFAGTAIGFQVASNLVLGILFFLLSWLVFDRCTREEKNAAPARRWLPRRTARASRIPTGLVGLRAVTWRDFTFISGGKFGLGVRFAVLVFLVALINFITAAFGNLSELTQEFEGGILIWISLLLTCVCLAVDAARVFQEEVRWKTISSLVTLPASVPELAYRKVAGVLLGTLPLLAAFVLGLILVPKVVGDFTRQVFKESYLFGFMVVAVLQFILFLHLTAFLSLLVKRGALALAVAIQYVGGSFVMTFAGMIFAFGGSSGPGIFLFLTATACVVLIGVLHQAIGRRLARCAAEE